MQPNAFSTACDRFPATICDAITLTQKFGVRYLWVDSLCLVQNDPSDLHGCIAGRECLFYSVLDISFGFLLVYFPHLQISETLKLLLTRSYHIGLQEHHLSRRILYFFQEHIIFRCQATEYQQRCHVVSKPDNSNDLNPILRQQRTS
ncbi:hypothetical protein QBC36DRAFT_182003 [Triangularia setosa]|uniref:Heterokaryon incompatibility domain-containing protein n=1 Tax=Triangularia setosa TaxID=2587417 RepID=A0AAN7A9X4_9PEZI|nr:hypothetical protein QBC36DRAFT_182003 [Podospora setosa]